MTEHMKNIKISKGLLSFLSGLGFMGLAFYILFFTFIEMENKLNYILLFSIATSFLGCIVIYFLSIAFKFVESKVKINTTIGGFLGGLLTMVAIILMILSFRLEEFGIKNLNIIDKIHPIITFFLASACMLLLIWPEKEEEKWL